MQRDGLVRYVKLYIVIAGNRSFAFSCLFFFFFFFLFSLSLSLVFVWMKPPQAPTVWLLRVLMNICFKSASVLFLLESVISSGGPRDGA